MTGGSWEAKAVPEDCGIANVGVQLSFYVAEQGYSSRAPSLKEEAPAFNFREFPV